MLIVDMSVKNWHLRESFAKGGYTEATLATRKELEDKMPGKEIENTKEEIRQWKLQVNKNDG